MLHSLIWKERELLTSNKKEMKHAAEMLKLLKAVQVLLQMAVKHCLRHQTKDTEVPKGNNLANGAAKEAAKGTFIMPLLPVLDLSHFDPEYSSAVLEKAKSWDYDEEDLNSGYRKDNKRVLPLPEPYQSQSRNVYETTHYGRDSLTA